MADQLAPWLQRQPDIANLFNPAFLGIVLRSAVSSYSRVRRGEGLPIALAFVVVGLSLSPTVRRHRPSRSVNMHSWGRDNPDAKVEAAAAARFLVPMTREAILCMTQAGLLQIDGSAIKVTGSLGKARDARGARGNLSEYLSMAKFVGSWLARSQSVSSVYESLGMRP
jgi:hypothetical protein